MAEFRTPTALFLERQGREPPARAEPRLRFTIATGRVELAAQRSRSRPSGVPAADAHDALGLCHLRTVSGLFLAASPAITDTDAWITAAARNGGATGEGRIVWREEFAFKGRLHRVDTENLAGENLRA